MAHVDLPDADRAGAVLRPSARMYVTGMSAGHTHGGWRRSCQTPPSTPTATAPKQVTDILSFRPQTPPLKFTVGEGSPARASGPRRPTGTQSLLGETANTTKSQAGV